MIADLFNTEVQQRFFEWSLILAAFASIACFAVEIRDRHRTRWVPWWVNANIFLSLFACILMRFELRFQNPPASVGMVALWVWFAVALWIRAVYRYRHPGERNRIAKTG